ncbi:WcaI family glycosyltransferase [Rheinheimera texasensis]|uniref:WcaI family glycosyltransferase n=1 Tax=Rheinheimera texasensis TaxID=306205 RepID=UPI0004E22563|nr:WcaI family glycosyltransferase [Rheinheimera texasensis]
MKFLLYSINHAPELTGIGKYNGEMVQALAQQGIDCLVVTAPPYYPEWQVHAGFSNAYCTEQQGKVRVLRNPLYVPNKVTTLKRLVHLASFALSSFGRLLTLLREKPDVVMLVQPTLFCAPGALIYSLLTGAKTVLHIQDFEVDAMFGLGMAGKDSLAPTPDAPSQPSAKKRLILGIERWLMNRFDKVSSISHSMLAKASQKGVAKDKLLFFPNWSDTGFVNPAVDSSALRAQWGYACDDKIVLYSGNIGQKQGLEIVLDAAAALADQPQVKFVIIGNGAYRDTLALEAARRGLTNVEFKPLQAWELVPQILVMTDVHLVVQKKGVADAVLPSKLTNILAAGGHALVTAEQDTELGELARRVPGIYHCIEPEDSNAFINGLRQCLAQDTRSTNTIARQYAVDHINSEQVLSRFAQDLVELVSKEFIR